MKMFSNGIDVLQGFLLVENFFPPSRLDAVKEAINGLVDMMANKLYDAGKIKSKNRLCFFY